MIYDDGCRFCRAIADTCGAYSRGAIRTFALLSPSAPDFLEPFYDDSRPQVDSVVSPGGLNWKNAPSDIDPEKDDMGFNIWVRSRTLDSKKVYYPFAPQLVILDDEYEPEDLLYGRKLIWPLLKLVLRGPRSEKVYT